jgi:hypothetical protein
MRALSTEVVLALRDAGGTKNAFGKSSEPRFTGWRSAFSAAMKRRRFKSGFSRRSAEMGDMPGQRGGMGKLGEEVPRKNAYNAQVPQGRHRLP